MFRDFANIKKLILLGLAVASTKVMLVLFAYFFDAPTYNQFNQIYYTSSIIILFGSLGFGLAVTRINITLKLILAAVTINSIVTYFILQLISAPFTDPFEISSLMIYSICISTSGIIVFQLLFSGRYKEYVSLTIFYSFLHLLIIPAVIFWEINLFIILPLVALIWFFTVYKKYTMQTNSTQSTLKEFYKIGLSAFIINSAVSLALAADKYFANHFFTVELANSYTFAWSLTAPMFYIGVLVERFLFSEENISKSNLLKKGFLYSSSFVIIYALLVLWIINILPSVVPDSVNYSYVIKIMTMMVIGYSVYVIFHFPVNAYLFKSLGVDKQKTISVVFTIIITVFLFVYVIILREMISINYVTLLILTWSYIFTLLITKMFIMFRDEKGTERAEKLMDINNLEP